MSCVPLRCCVAGCKAQASSRKEARQSQNRMFRFVSEKPVRYKTAKSTSLARKRFQLWLSVLRTTAETSKFLWICSVHFVKGRPAPLSDCDNVDWVPTLKLNDAVQENGWLSPSKIKLCREVTIVLKNINSSAAADDDTTADPIEPETPTVNERTESTIVPDLEGPFCRLCLEKTDQLRPLYPASRAPNSHLVQLIEKIAYIRINFETDYNSFTCHQCQERLEEFQRFRQQWQRNDALLTVMRQRNLYITPAPLVSVPIDNLMEPCLAPVMEPCPVPVIEPCPAPVMETLLAPVDFHADENGHKMDQTEQELSFTEPTVLYEAVDQSMELEDEFKAEAPELAVHSTELYDVIIQSCNEESTDEAEQIVDQPQIETIYLSSESDNEIEAAAPEQVPDVNSSKTGDNDRDIQVLVKEKLDWFSKRKKKNKSKRNSLRSAKKSANRIKPMNSTL